MGNKERQTVNNWPQQLGFESKSEHIPLPHSQNHSLCSVEKEAYSASLSLSSPCISFLFSTLSTFTSPNFFLSHFPDPQPSLL